MPQNYQQIDNPQPSFWCISKTKTGAEAPEPNVFVGSTPTSWGTRWDCWAEFGFPSPID